MNEEDKKTLTISQIQIGSNVYDILDVHILDRVYPIGSIYMSVNNVSPETFLGGTWDQIENRFLLAASDNYVANSTGGEANHTLSINELPGHSHTVPQHGHGYTNPTVTLPNHQHGNTNGNYLVYNANLNQNRTAFAAGKYYRASVANTGNPTSLPNCTVSGGGVQDKAAFSTQNTGNGIPHNNMPPYLAVYMWQRTK